MGGHEEEALLGSKKGQEGEGTMWSEVREEGLSQIWSTGSQSSGKIRSFHLGIEHIGPGWYHS